MTPFELTSVFITVAALLSFASHRLMRVPPAIGLTLLSLLLASLLLAVGKVEGLANAVHQGTIIATVANINFNHLVLHGMLAFLLFAGSLHLDFASLRGERMVVLLLAVVSTGISTVLVGGLVWLVTMGLGLPVPLLSALLLGALLSPTDPISALAILQRMGVPARINSKLSGEALLNDAVGAVLFVSLLDAAQGGGFPGFGSFAWLLLREAGGGLLLGLVCGLLAAAMLRRINEYRTEILITLALAMGGYALADAVHVSAPLEAVVSGLCLGGVLRKHVFSERAQDYVDKFWDLVDSILNALLFLLLGLELVVVPLQPIFLLAGLLTVPMVLLARSVSVGAVLVPIQGATPATRRLMFLMTWGGLRGALSVALALSLPAAPERGLLLTITYVVVVFSIVAQGLTVGRLARRLGLTDEPETLRGADTAEGVQ